MEIVDAIFSRQSIQTLRPDPVPRDLVERLLAAAVQAPNHYRVRPWRFVVLQGQARERLGDVFAEYPAAQTHPDLPPAALDKERAKALRSPLLIAVGVDAPADPRVIEIENICAAAAAVENLLLAAACPRPGGQVAHRRRGLRPAGQGLPRFSTRPAYRCFSVYWLS